MKTFNYTPNLAGLNIVKNETEQNNKFFYSGHPNFLIPDFTPKTEGYPQIEDIWTSYVTYLEKVKKKECYDQDGGEIISHSIIDILTGLTKCTYEAVMVSFSENEEPKDYLVEVEGYIIEESDKSCYFLATKVTEGVKVNNDGLNRLDNLTFVVTGKIETYSNRDELKNLIESLGGKISGSVSIKTNYLITNDTSSGSTKNRDAEKFGVKIISEIEFNKMIGK